MPLTIGSIRKAWIIIEPNRRAGIGRPEQMLKEIKPLRTQREFEKMVRAIGALADKPRLSTADQLRLEVLALIVDRYEREQIPDQAESPVEFLRGHMDNSGRSQAELAALLGSKSLASEILNRRRHMSLDVIRKISDAWGVPIALLTPQYRLERRRA